MAPMPFTGRACDHPRVTESTSVDETPRLDRRADGRLVVGVCRGLADHLGLEVVIVRLAFSLLIVAGGMGVAAYIALWVLVPQRDEPAGRRDWTQLAAYSALIFGLSFLTWASGLAKAALWPIVAGGIRVAVFWQ